MQQARYQSQELSVLLESSRKQAFNGVLHLESLVNPQEKPRSRILIFKKGQITYGGDRVPTNLEFFQILGEKLQSKLMNTAIEFGKQKVTNPNSVREFLEIFTKMKLFKWEDLEKLIFTQVVITLEQILPYSGQVRYDTESNFDLSYDDECRGLDWSAIALELERRQQQWKALAPKIPSMEAIPRLSKTPLHAIADLTVRQHLEKWVDGVRSLIDIAEAVNKDPLQIARTYTNWVQVDWVVLSDRENNQPSITETKATIANKWNCLRSIKPIGDLFGDKIRFKNYCTSISRIINYFFPKVQLY